MKFPNSLRLPGEFFKFDLKDTLRVGLFIVSTSFLLGGIYAQRKADVASLSENTANVKSSLERELKAVREQVATVSDAVQKRSTTEASILTALDGIRTELRYTNDKIDTLRQDVRDRTHAPR